MPSDLEYRNTVLSAKEIERRILELVAQRGEHKTICPSEIARTMDSHNWRLLMPNVRKVGLRLEEAGKIDVTQKGHKVLGRSARGPIRYRLRRIERED